MIKLSQLTALDIENTVLKDVNSVPSLYVYQAPNNNVINSLILQEESGRTLNQMTRRYAMAPYWTNVLLGTQNFYPEQGLKINDYHNNHELHKLTSEQVLPSLQFKKAFLYFAQGILTNSSTKGYWIRIFCKLSNGAEVNLCSVVDFVNDSNIKAKSAKIYESKIYNEALELEFLDIEYLINSPSAEIKKIRELLFGNEVPLTYMIEYAEFDDEGIDDFIEGNYTFTSLNFKVINSQSLPITLQNEELLCKIELTNNGYALTSSVYHSTYNIEAYLDNMKKQDETYSVTHYYTVNQYDSENKQIGLNVNLSSNPVDKFSSIIYRPLLSNNCDHAKIDLTTKIVNDNSGMTISRTSSIILTTEEVGKFKSIEQIQLQGLSTNKVQQIVNKQINKIVHDIKTPQIIQVEKITYLQSQPLNKLIIYNSNFTATLKLPQYILQQKELYLKIGSNIIIQNNYNRINVFKIPKEAYLTQEKQYILLDQNKEMISFGQIIKSENYNVMDFVATHESAGIIQEMDLNPGGETGGIKGGTQISEEIIL